MREEHISLLKCIKCKGKLDFSRDHYHKIKDDKIELGVLSCLQCKAFYPIINGVGVFFPEQLLGHYLNEKEKEICCQIGLKYGFLKNELNKIEKKQLNVAKNWSYEWNEVYNYSKEDLEKDDFFGENLFFKFIPIMPVDFNDKVVVIWCGGKGREAYHISKYKPRLIVVNEIGDEIYGIRSLGSDTDNWLLLRCDMNDNPLKAELADYSICDHALQHVANHKLGFLKMLEVLKIEGIFGLNVYSYENNFLMIHIVEPLKLILHKLPLAVQADIAFVPAIFIYLLIHLFYVPIGRIFSDNICKQIPLFDHMIFWSKNSFKFMRTTCFDLIHAPIVHYFKESEMIDMVNRNNVTIMRLSNTHGTTWSLIGEKRRITEIKR